MIVSGGENVFPSEVEDLLARLPQVREVAVIGVPDDEYGQRLAAYLVLHPGETLDAEAVREYVRHYLARFSVPRDVVFVEVPAPQRHRQGAHPGAAGGRRLTRTAVHGGAGHLPTGPARAVVVQRTIAGADTPNTAA